MLQKLANRTEARKVVPALYPPAFDGALQLDCMSSEESGGEEPAPVGQGAETVQVFRTRGLAWRSARLLRMYAVLDTQDKLDKDRFRRDMGGLVEAYQEVARRLGIMNENEPPRPSGPVLVK